MPKSDEDDRPRQQGLPMTRQILNTPAAKAPSTVSVTGKIDDRARTQVAAGPRLERRLKQPRSLAFVEAMTKLDAGTHVRDSRAVEALIDAIDTEFADLTIDQRPLGFVVRCYLGPEYEVHILDLTATSIVAHYRFGQAMPEPFERARALAVHQSGAALNTYALVEVYSDRVVLVAPGGTVSSAAL
jgi:hypothetical protein